ncbi:hypothetical protein [Dermabacter sp. Marseille-Q3180]|uniref:hypothetical protein n=1 Tax=Dermabacter sp. Marseille-Q3180 TaxID=2758090 RepID=UPI0020250787|nr:hypothetical protein [Dermabacter sp. Marseille-Q3180]
MRMIATLESMHEISHARTRVAGAGLIAACLALLAALILAPSLHWGGLRKDATPPIDRVHTLYVTSGLTWADITKEDTPALWCFAENSGAAGLALSSESVMPTKRQGLETLATGARTPALGDTDAAGRGGSPGGKEWSDATSALAEAGISLVDLGDVATGKDVSRFAHERSVRRIDAAFAKYAGECGERGVALASIGSLNPSSEQAYEVEHTRGYDALPIPLNLQVYIDSRWGPAFLTSPSTRQVGVVMNLDLAASLTDTGQVGMGRAAVGTATHKGTQLAHAREVTFASRTTEDALAPLLGALITVLLIAGVLARRVPAARHIASVGLLAIPVGYTSSILPLSTLVNLGIHPLFAIAAWTIFGTAALGAGLTFGVRLLASALPEHSRRLLTSGLAALMTVAAIVLDAALGSHASFTSLLGNQPIYAGRFYGLSNHITGITLAAWALGVGMLIHALPAFTTGRRPGLARVLFVGGTGALVGFCSIAPGMGADAGSALIYAPVTLVACLALSGIRLRPWHVLAALAAGTGVFAFAGALDYMRPASSRTHLGEFVATLVEKGSPAGAASQFWAVFADRTSRMLEPLTLYSPLLMVPPVLIALALTYGAVRRGSLAHELPYLYRLRLAAVAGAWIGALTNDTGLVLVGLAYVVGVALSLTARASLSARAPREARPPAPPTPQKL